MILCTEAFKKTLCTILERMVDKNNKTWSEKLPEALWAYKTTIRSITQATPYSMVFGGEVVLPLEIQLPSLRIAVHERITTEEKASLRLAELEALDEIGSKAQQNPELYRHRMSKAFNKRVRPRSFQKGDLVLAIRTLMIINKKKGQLEPNWEGPFAIEKVYSNRTYLLITMEGERIIPPTNVHFLKRYYPWKDHTST